ncbi:MAG: hypothetical protein WD055_06075 [Candidatus Dependentiae bacterium]
MNVYLFSRKKSLFCTVLLLLSIHTTVCFFGHTDIIPRSETVNAARTLAGWQEHINDYDVGRTYWSFYVAPEYKRSFNNQQLVDFLLGGNECFGVQGSRLPDGRSQCALLADYFGLPQDFKSKIQFSPQITSFIFDMNAYLGLDGLCEGLYLRFHAPVVHTKWDLNLCECVDMKGTNTYPAGYMSAQEVPRDDLSSSFQEAITGRFCSTCKQQKKFTYGDMKNALEFGRIQGRRNLSRLSDVHMALGYNFFNSDDHHIGLNARISFPAGNRPDPDFFFAPIVGNGHHWEAGVGYTSHIILWSSNDELDFAGFWLDANITHMFADEQCRSYDFCDNPGSRYILLSKIIPVEDAQVEVDGMPIPSQYQGRLFPAINLTTLQSKTSFKVQVDMVAKMSLQINGLQWDLGYNLWYRSAEKLHSRCSFDDCLAFKGDAQLYGFASQSMGDLMINDPLALNVSQHEATLYGGQGDGNFVAGAEFANANADNPALATDVNGNPLEQLNQNDAFNLMIAQQQISTSDGPILLTDCDIDECSALMPKALSHKVFGNVGYTWEHPNICFAPFLNLGTEVEWRCNCVNNNSAISQWGVWAKAGLSY